MASKAKWPARATWGAGFVTALIGCWVVYAAASTIPMPWGLFFGLLGLSAFCPVAVIFVLLFGGTMRTIAGYIDREIAKGELEGKPSDASPPYVKF
jgi:hypothetical protein